MGLRAWYCWLRKRRLKDVPCMSDDFLAVHPYFEHPQVRGPFEHLHDRQSQGQRRCYLGLT